VNDLPSVLRALVEELAKAHGFSHDYEPGSIRQTAIGHASSTLPAALFLAWLERCPEARKFLEQHLVFPGLGGANHGAAVPAADGGLDRYRRDPPPDAFYGDEMESWDYGKELRNDGEGTFEPDTETDR
jgi:hypothetical protein